MCRRGVGRGRAGGPGGRGAFTLVELLVVIAILVLLLSLLMPSLSNAKEQARQVQCRGNLRVLSMACRMYEAASNQYMVLRQYYPVGTVATWLGGWHSYLATRVREFGQARQAGAYLCPSYPDRKAAVSYGRNGQIGDGYYVQGYRRLDTWPRMDKHFAHRSWRVFEMACHDMYFVSRSWEPAYIAPLHERGTRTIAVFLDGHTQKMTYDEFHDPARPRPSPQWPWE